MRSAHFVLRPTPPFRLDLTVWAIRRRPENRLDHWNGETYERVLPVGNRVAFVRVVQVGPAARPELDVAVSGTPPNGSWKPAVISAMERLLGFRLDLRPFYSLAQQHPRLRELANRFRGLKAPRFPTVWEGLVNGITCQQFSLHVGILMLNRLSAARGASFEVPDGVRHAFPRPQDLASTTIHTLRAMGFNGVKSRALIELGQQVSGGYLDLESLENLENREALAGLMALPAVGRWTAEYTLLRGMGRIDLFPGDDVGARNNLQRWMRLRVPLDYDRVSRLLARWKPYAGLIYFHLLLDSLARAGFVQPTIGGREPRLAGRNG